MRLVKGPTLNYVEYDRQTLALTVPYYVTHREAKALIQRNAPCDAVVIEFFTEVHYFTQVVEPHPDCEAPHKEQVPNRFTNIRCEAFPDVLPEHRGSVASLGIKNRVVRIPLVQRPTMEALSDEEAPSRP